MMNWKLETRPIKSLRKHPDNPRKLTKDQFDQLKTSIDKFGLIDKPIITHDGIIIGGHQRIEVLKKLAHKEVECYVAPNDISEKDINELNIRLNKNTGEFDYEILANCWDLPDLVEWGFKPEELLGHTIDEEVPTKKEKESKSKSSTCPACGYEF